MPQPIYTAENCEAAFQLLWSYSLFWRVKPTQFDWFDPLKAQTENDGIRLLRHEFKPPNVSQFLVSTRPPTTPLLIAQRIKGRLQYLLRDVIAGGLSTQLRASQRGLDAA